MPFVAGHKKVPGSGMKKGTKIASTKHKETALETFERMMGKGPIEYCMELIENLESDRERLKAVTELIPYMKPKLAQTQVTAQVNVNQSMDELLEEFNKLDERGSA